MVASTRTVQLWIAGVAGAYFLWRAANKPRVALRPRRDQITALFDAAPAEGPVTMLNLIKFRSRAVYEDNRATELTGAEAYDLYELMNSKLVESCGGKVIFSGDARTLVIGYGSEAEFDRVLVVQFPTMTAYNEVAGKCIGAQKATGFQDHQFAAIAHQQLIRVDPKNASKE